MKLITFEKMRKCSFLSSVMEAGDHFKNGASSKSQTSRRNIFRLKRK